LVAANTLVLGLTVSTFNLWCPAYRRMPGQPDSVRESQYPETYMQRNRAILELPVWAESDVICCQEFWYSNPDVFNLYVRALGGRYRMHGLQRPGGPDGARRPDGLFMAIAREWDVVHESDIDFEDAAGRCAQLLHLRRSAAASQQQSDALGGGQAASIDEILVANVHLLFPHNEASARIRVREVHKLLAYLDLYKRRLARPPPTLICGDFNGDSDSKVVQFLRRYGWQCSYSHVSGQPWVSHYTHENEAKGVDYVAELRPRTYSPPPFPPSLLAAPHTPRRLTPDGFGRRTPPPCADLAAQPLPSTDTRRGLDRLCLL